MAFELKIKNGIVEVTFHGRITAKDLEGLADETEKFEFEFEVTPDRIVDLSPSEGIDLDYRAMEVFANKRRRAPLKNSVKSAIVASGPMQYGFALVFQTINDNPKIRLQIFTEKARALLWLKIRDDSDRTVTAQDRVGAG
jgi:hypothetical protein